MGVKTTNKQTQLGPVHALYRLLLFLGLFVIESAILGPWIVRSRLLYGFGFYLYGNLGKLVILFAVIFPLFARDRLHEIRTPVWQRGRAVYFVAAMALLAAFFPFAKNLLTYSSPRENPVFTVITHLILLSIPGYTLIGLFGLKYLVAFVRSFRRELLLTAGISILIDFIIFRVWAFWPFFSRLVLTSVAFLLSLTFPGVYVTPPWTLGVGDFAAQILQACSGLDSFAMFTALYLLIGYLDRRVISPVKFSLSYLPLALGLFAVNILRVYLLYLIGILWSPNLALELFHTYAGLVLFLGYFLLFVKFLYPKLRK
jgi:exosortase/archaeosortase family protein